MATDVTICSAALQLLGDAAIDSLSDNTKRAEYCNSIYGIARDEVLRSHPWNCLTTRVALSPLAAAPVSRWAYQFAKPSNFLRLLNVTDDEDNSLDYAFEANRVLADTDSIVMHFIERKSEGNWDAGLVNVMVARMQVALAYPITKSTSLRDSLKEDFYRQKTGVLAQAKAQDGQENPPEDWGDSPLTAVRG